MNEQSNPIMVRHNPQEHRFEVDVGGELSVADYEQRGTDMIMTHTFVPPALRGQGIAEKMVRVALEFARTERLRVVPACSYVAAFIKRHPEFHPLLAA
jgi:predicted GNAT family acetyltransferase